MSEDRLTESVPYPKRKLERTTAVPKTVDRIPAIILPRQSGGIFMYALPDFWQRQYCAGISFMRTK